MNHQIRFLSFLFFLISILQSSGFALPSPNQKAANTRYEAENAVLSGVTIANSLPGYSGTGYMDGGSFDQAGDKITFAVKVSATASYPLTIRYQNTCGICEKAQNISINGGPDKYTVFNGTSASWQDLNFGNVDLVAGDNTITISKSWGWTHIDYIEIGENDVTAPTAPNNVKSSAVTQTSFTLSWDASTDHVGVTGYDVYFGDILKKTVSGNSVSITDLNCATGYTSITVKAKDAAGNISEASNPVNVSTTACMAFTLKVTGGSGNGTYNSGKQVAVVANRAPSGKIFDKWTGSAAILNPNLETTSILMPESNVEITATYKDISPALLLDPKATPETVALWNYLKSVYGQKMLTGCWTESQFGGNSKVYSCTGKMPAIWGQDMNSWYRNRTEALWKQTWDSNIAGFKTAHSRGQILQINWHWQMPSSKVNGVYTRDAWGKDVSGNVQMMTAQQWSDIVTPGTALYDAMIEDIDYHVVNFLKKIVDANGNPIPIIFRPLHEIDGGWFWWTCTSDPTKTAKLYQIMQDRIMNYQGCHNLIWVFNPGVICNGGSWPPYQNSELARRKAFYPGNAFCDITGIDLYGYDPAVRGTYVSTGKTYRDAWNLMKAISPEKMIALCEAEGLPNPEKCFTDPNYAPWLYCLPWYSDNYTDEATGATRDLCAWNQIQFKSTYILNASDLSVTSVAEPITKGDAVFKLFPNPANEQVTIQLSESVQHSFFSILVFNSEGKLMMEKTFRDDSRLSFDTKGLKPGMYLIQLRQNSKNFCEKLLIK